MSRTNIVPSILFPHGEILDRAKESVKDVYQRAYDLFSSDPTIWKQDIMGEHDKDKKLLHCCAGYGISHSALHGLHVIDASTLDFYLRPLIAFIPSEYHKFILPDIQQEQNIEATIAAWNDAPGRTLGDVLAALRSVIESEEKSPTEVPERLRPKQPL